MFKYFRCQVIKRQLEYVIINCSVSENSGDAKERQVESNVKANLVSPIQIDANKAVYESMDNRTDAEVSADFGTDNEIVGVSPTMLPDARQLQCV